MLSSRCNYIAKGLLLNHGATKRMMTTVAARSIHATSSSTGMVVPSMYSHHNNNKNSYYHDSNIQYRTMGTSVKEVATADDALRFSGYSAIDFTILEDAPVYDAVQKFAAYNIGCLVTVDTAGMCICCCCVYSFVLFVCVVYLYGVLFAKKNSN